MPPKHIGAATDYLATYKDAQPPSAHDLLFDQADGGPDRAGIPRKIGWFIRAVQAAGSLTFVVAANFLIYTAPYLAALKYAGALTESACRFASAWRPQRRLSRHSAYPSS